MPDFRCNLRIEKATVFQYNICAKNRPKIALFIFLNRTFMALNIIGMMKLEIERKFLIIELPANFLSRYEGVNIRQGYIAIDNDGTEVRIRQMDRSFYLTIKGKGGLARKEFEREIPIEDFNALWEMTVNRRIQKRRYKVKYNHLTLEIDQFLGELDGLWMAEVEFASEAESQEFVPPDWFNLEITHDDHYKNASLALFGFPK